MNIETHVASQVRALADLDLEGLRAEWRHLFGAAPKLRSPDQLRQILAWRLQAARFGGLDPEVRRSLTRSGKRRDPKAGLGQGASLSREWQGRRHDVETVDGGFRYQGVTYRSLSEVARVITGTRWNGPRFFGLRTAEAGG